MDKELLALRNHALSLGIALDDQQLALFNAYKNEILQWNTKTNLIPKIPRVTSSSAIFWTP
jgi:16S rRNA G527 N7-methylase RsmG